MSTTTPTPDASSEAGKLVPSQVLNTIVEELNRLLAIYPEAMRLMFAMEVPCTQQLVDDPYVLVNSQEVERQRPVFYVTSIGLLNGLVYKVTGSHIMAVWDNHPDVSDRLVRFATWQDQLADDTLLCTKETIVAGVGEVLEKARAADPEAITTLVTEPFQVQDGHTLTLGNVIDSIMKRLVQPDNAVSPNPFTVVQGLYERTEQLRAYISSWVQTELDGRYREYVSDVFLTSLLLDGLQPILRKSKPKGEEHLEHPFERRAQLAYAVGCTMFESRLEHDCKAGGNGHHVAQWFAEHIEQFNVMPPA
jgi:hypothetical protein